MISFLCSFFFLPFFPHRVLGCRDLRFVCFSLSLSLSPQFSYIFLFLFLYLFWLTCRAGRQCCKGQQDGQDHPAPHEPRHPQRWRAGPSAVPCHHSRFGFFFFLSFFLQTSFFFCFFFFFCLFVCFFFGLSTIITILCSFFMSIFFFNSEIFLHYNLSLSLCVCVCVLTHDSFWCDSEHPLCSAAQGYGCPLPGLWLWSCATANTQRSLGEGCCCWGRWQQWRLWWCRRILRWRSEKPVVLFFHTKNNKK